MRARPRQAKACPQAASCVTDDRSRNGIRRALAAALEAWPVAPQVLAPVAGQLRTWTSTARAMNAVCRVSVNSPPSPEAAAAHFTVQVAVPRYRPPCLGTAGSVVAEGAYRPSGARPRVPPACCGTGLGTEVPTNSNIIRSVVDFRKHRAPAKPLVLAALVASHAGPCDHGPCALTDLLAVERLDDPRCCASHHPEALRTTT